jgi:N-acetyl sugar amidotransferase
MHPLTITWAPFIYTDIGWKNYLAFKDSGFDNLLFFPDGKIHRKLSRIAFEYVGDNFLPFIYGQKAYAFHIAVSQKIPLIFFGESGEVEYGGSLKNVEKSHESVEDWEELYFKGAGLDSLIEKGVETGVITQAEAKNNSLKFYRPPPLDEIAACGAEMHWFSFYRKWVPQENYYYAIENTGFEANKGRSEGTYSKYASLDDRTDGFHYYMAFIKFGIGRATSDAAHEIRDGHITREEAVSLVSKYDGEFPVKQFPQFLDYIGITEERFWEVVDFYRQRTVGIWENMDEGWVLCHNVAGTGTRD